MPPTELKVVGSYLLGTCIKPEINVDVAVTMPQVSLAMPAPKCPGAWLSPIHSCHPPALPAPFLSEVTASACAVWLLPQGAGEWNLTTHSAGA